MMVALASIRPRLQPEATDQGQEMESDDNLAIEELDRTASTQL